MSNEASLSNMFAQVLHRTLPAQWQSDVERPADRRGPDAWLHITTPTGAHERFAVEIKSRFEPRDIHHLIPQVASWDASGSVVLVAPYLSARTRQILREHGFSYADTAGNLRLSSGTLFIESTGNADKARRTERPLKSLRGPLTGRIIRYLCDAVPPRRVRQIAGDTHAPAGNVSRILRFLECERFVMLDERRTVVGVDWEALLANWGAELATSRFTRTYLEPRGPEAVLKRLTRSTEQHAITGSFAAAKIVPVTLASAIDIYVDDIDAFASTLNVYPTEGIGNVRLIAAYDNVVFERTMKRGDLTLANPSQIAADLGTLPKRSDDEYTELISWMKNHERIWRIA